MNANSIKIAVAVNDAYVRHLAVMLSSLFRNSIKAKEIVLYVISEGLSDSNRNILNGMASEFGAEIHYPVFDVSILGECPLHGHIAIPTYFRLFLHKLLPCDVDKCIYLDSDLLVLCGIEKLWAVDLGSYMVGGVQDLECNETSSRSPMERVYINAGVICVNLKRWREESIELVFLDCLRSNYEQLKFWDQDVLNRCLRGRIMLLESSWNMTRRGAFDLYLPLLFRVSRCMPRIIHFTSAYKPWMNSDNHPLKRLYWSYSKNVKGFEYKTERRTFHEWACYISLRCRLLILKFKTIFNAK